VTRHVAVVGGGPAGLIAAETLAAAGIKVRLYEARRSVGRKFLLAGRGGLNITHSEEVSVMLERYGTGAPVIGRALDEFGADDLQAWCAALGEPTFVGTSGRVFPASFRATPLLRAWLRRLAEQGVEILTQHRWLGWSASGELQFEAPNSTHTISPDAVVFALGGASWPKVGGDGSWAAAFEDRGIGVTTLTAANCGLEVGWSDIMRTRFAGEPIKNTIFSVGGRSVRGDAVVTVSGLEGGPIYALGPLLRQDPPGSLVLDTQPDLSAEQLTTRLSKRRPKASEAKWLSSANLSPVVVALAREATDNALPQDPAELAHLLKALPIGVTGLAVIDRAISTAGGVDLDQLDERFMVAQHPGVFVAGEMLDWEAPTGGYLLQGCFSTGVAAAQGVVAWLAAPGAN